MYRQGHNGLLSTYRQAWRRRGVVGWIVAALLIGFYVALYFTESFDQVAEELGLRNRWFLYGALYCVLMAGGAVYYLRRHGSSRYNQLRIATNLIMQIGFAFLLPFFMTVMGTKDFYFSYFWPLKIDYLYPSTILQYPFLIVLYSMLSVTVLVPLMAIFFGKRWYCSWVCGCGALANTFGDPWRHLTSKSTRSWRFEQVSIHLVLALALATTAVVFINWGIGKDHPTFAAFAFEVQAWYGIIVGSVLAGVVGTGLYPLLGPRVWCRYFCPMAAMLGLMQKAGRFRVRVKDDMCISCGNCSAYCEMGIDVRAYAQTNQSFTRAACVGCGMCAHICPRGVLRLESRWRRHPDKQRQGLAVIDV